MYCYVLTLSRGLISITKIVRVHPVFLGVKVNNYFIGFNIKYKFVFVFCGASTTDKLSILQGVERLFTVRGQSYLSRLPKY